jgi:hypothetical protein
MSFNNLPASLQSIIQQGYLERAFQDALRANLGFRAIADKEPFPAQIGETLTKTRRGLLAPKTTPISTPSNTDITSGLTASNYSVEQYTLSINQYADMMMLNLVANAVAIVPQFLQNASALGEAAARTVDILAQQALFNSYMGGNTRVTATLGSPAATINVDDIRGFQNTLNSEGQVVAVSTSNKVVVSVNGTSYNLQGATADGSNVSTAPGGISGTLTMDANVSTTNGTTGNSVVSSVAPSIIRPYVTSSGLQAATTAAISATSDNNGGQMTTQMVLAAKAQLRLNNVQPMRDGRFILYADPAHLTGIYQDQAFQRFFVGETGSTEWRNGVVGELLGVKVVETNLNPVQTLGGNMIRRAILCGQGALIEGEFTRTGYAAMNGASPEDLSITMVDGIAHITREPLDVLQQVLTQSYSYIGGFTVPTDSTANPTVLPTATNALYKRAVIVESL